MRIVLWRRLLLVQRGFVLRRKESWICSLQHFHTHGRRKDIYKRDHVGEHGHASASLFRRACSVIIGKRRRLAERGRTKRRHTWKCRLLSSGKAYVLEPLHDCVGVNRRRRRAPMLPIRYRCILWGMQSDTRLFYYPEICGLSFSPLQICHLSLRRYHPRHTLTK